MNRNLIIGVGVYLTMAFSAAGAEPAGSMEQRDRALRLLHESYQETCPICAEQTQHKAFILLNEALPPGTIIGSDQRCVFIRAPEKESNTMLLSCDTLPDNGTRSAVILRFHTAADHLVGVSRLDYTNEKTAEEFNFASPGFRCRGSAVVIDYSYGDGPAYNYHVKTDQLYIHCRILSLQPLR
jgi:hypothetical protein